MPNVDNLRNRILGEAHRSVYFNHLVSMKMYHDLRYVFMFDGLKRNIAEFFAKCPNSQQVKG